MKRIMFIAAIVILWTTQASAEAGFGIGLLAGTSYYTQDVLDDSQGKLGPIASGNLIFAITDYLSVGVNLEGDYHWFHVDMPGATPDLSLGNPTTLSVLPFVELRHVSSYGGRPTFAPYATLGLGYNFNFFDVSNKAKGLFGSGYDLNLDNTFAIKGGIGADYFLTKGLALNFELGWKYNRGNYHVHSLGTEIFTGSFNADTFNVLFGVRYYIF